MRPLLCIFIDGLSPDSLSRMPFLSSFPSRGRIRGEYGYSVASHASMYSGVHTARHKRWFVWQRSPETSPFRKFKPLFSLPLANSLPAKLILHRLAVASLPEPNTSFFGVPRFIHVPVRFMSDLDVSEKKRCDLPGYLSEVPSLFDILRQEQVATTVAGLEEAVRGNGALLEGAELRVPTPFIFWFIGEVDHFSHAHGQASAESGRRLAGLDRLLEKKVGDLRRLAGDVDVLLWSDHGHVAVEKRLDIYRAFSRAGLDLNRIFHVIDGTFARFWLGETRDEERVHKGLAALGEDGATLSVADQKRFRVYPGDNRYGDLIFSLHPGRIFSRTIWGWSRKMISMHGYDPAHRQNDGVLLSTLPLAGGRVPELIDITPSILSRFGLARAHMEGTPFWS